MCFLFSPRERQHIDKFDPHPFPEQSQKVVHDCCFISRGMHAKHHESGPQMASCPVPPSSHFKGVPLSFPPLPVEERERDIYIYTYIHMYVWNAAVLLTIGNASCLQLSTFLLSVVFGSFFAYGLRFLLRVRAFFLEVSFFAYNGQLCLRSTSTDNKQRSSTVSKEAQTVTKRLEL